MGRIGGVSRPVAIMVAVICLSASTAAAATGNLGLTIAAVALSIATIVVTIDRLSREAARTPEPPIIGRLELAAQRIHSAMSEEQLASRTAEELIDLLGTSSVAFVPVERERLVIDRGAGGLVVKPASRSFLAEVSMQRPTSKLAASSAEGDVALIACPVRIAAITVAVVVGVRDAERPFTLTEQHVLIRLATISAKALDVLRRDPSASRRDGVVLPTEADLGRDLEAFRGDRREATTVLAHVDIDGYLRLVSASGSDAAEAMLDTLLRILEVETRDSDRIYRIGTDEFALLLRNLRSDQTVRVLDRIRVAVHASGFVRPDTRTPVTVSIGAAFVYARDPSRAERAAISALAQAQEAGGDRVVISNEGPFASPQHQDAPPTRA
jgi:diguanylate cyclase (GGDEF)-like protein